MKKFIFSLGLALVTVTTMAQQHLSQSFLNVRSLQPGTNSAVDYIGLTNLSSLTTNIGAIYSSTNLAYTNAAGTYVHPGLAAVIAAMGTTNQYTVPSIFKDVSLYTDRNGLPINYVTFTGAGSVPGDTNRTLVSGQTLMIELVSSAWLTNGAYGFLFRPVWDGETAINYTADDWWVVLPTSAGIARAKQHLVTNAPVWRWPGAEKLRLVLITNNVTTITGTASTVTNASHITKITLTGFRP